MTEEFKPNARILVQQFSEKWSRMKQGELYYVNWGKDAKLMKNLLAVFTYEDLLIKIDLYLEDLRPFIVEGGHSIGLFHAMINSYSNANVKQRKIMNERKELNENPGKERVSRSEPKPIQSMLHCHECDKPIIEGEWVKHMATHNELRTV